MSGMWSSDGEWGSETIHVTILLGTLGDMINGYLEAAAKTS